MEELTDSSSPSPGRYSSAERPNGTRTLFFIDNGESEAIEAKVLPEESDIEEPE